GDEDLLPVLRDVGRDDRVAALPGGGVLGERHAQLLGAAASAFLDRLRVAAAVAQQGGRGALVSRPGGTLGDDDREGHAASRSSMAIAASNRLRSRASGKTHKVAPMTRMNPPNQRKLTIGLTKTLKFAWPVDGSTPKGV